MTIRTDNIQFTYPGGAHALRGVTLQINDGERVAIVGQNGAGKTTLVKHFNGLLRPDEGDVRIDDWNTRDHTVAQTAARVGYVFQNPDDQIVERKVLDEAAFGPRHLGQGKEESEAAALAALELVGLGDQTDTHPYDLTPSQRKLLTLASVLAMQTPTVILDEPTMGQDAAGVALVGRIVAGLHAEGRTVITITHDIDFCGLYFDRVIVMAQGQIIGEGPAAEILAQDDLLASTNVEPPQLVRLAEAIGLASTPLTVADFVRILAEERPPAARS